MKELFKRNKFVYYPISVFGWIIALVFILLIVQIFKFANASAGSFSDLFYLFFPYVVCYSVVYYWIASIFSKSIRR